LYTYLRQLVPGLQIQASGGVRDVADLHALRDCGVAGAVLGRSLLEGRLDLTAALKC
jgi:phosphoribosylformimino-5-aminoimidazole carboxamide ribotide isomerase